MPLRTIHVGYEFDIDEKVRETLKEILNIQVDSKSIVAIMYTDKKPEERSNDFNMDRWYQSKLVKDEPAFIKGLYVEKTKKKYIVAFVTIGAQQIWTIIYKTTGKAPIDIKKDVRNTRLYDYIDLSEKKIPVSAKPYIFKDHMVIRF